MTMEEFNEIVISNGLKLDRNISTSYAFYKNMIVIIYDKDYGESAVWKGSGFSKYIGSKSNVEEMVKKCIIAFKKEEQENKLKKIVMDF